MSKQLLTFGDLITPELMRRCWTQRRLSEVTDIPERTISVLMQRQVKKGRVGGRADVIGKILITLGLPTDIPLLIKKH